MSIGTTSSCSTPWSPRRLEGATFSGGAVAGEYLTAADPRGRAAHPMTCLVKRFKVARDRDAEVADLLLRTHAAAGMTRPDIVVSAPVSQAIDRFAAVRGHVARALGARAADVLTELLEIPGYREMSLTERHAATARASGCRFAVSAPAAIREQIVLLIDDVVASGETARCIADALRRAGAREVQFVALALTAPADART